VAGGARTQRRGWIGAGLIALGTYGFVATLQPDANFGRVLAAYGAGSLLWGVLVDGSAPTATTSSARCSACSASS
jgi:small multidrug resistance family-3 protein